MKSKLKRISAVIDAGLYEEVIKIAELDNRSLNYTIILLLQKAIKEKNRKRSKNQVEITDFSSN